VEVWWEMMQIGPALKAHSRSTRGPPDKKARPALP